MSWLLKMVLLVLALALVLAGLPIAMPMAPCPQCVLPAAAWCLLALLATVAAVVAPASSGERVGVLSVRLPARLWARPLERPPQRRLHRVSPDVG
jgi:hypothetical protein